MDQFIDRHDAAIVGVLEVVRMQPPMPFSGGSHESIGLRSPLAGCATIQSPPRTRPYLAALALLLMTTVVFAGDWPAYRHDVARSAVTLDRLSFPLALAWEQRAAQPPAPAWPKPVKLLNRLDFDYAPKPVIAGGIVCIASSSDDTVLAFDGAIGRER